MGTTASTVRVAVDRARERGIRAGALRIRMFRPLPGKILRDYLVRAKHVAVLDRDLCPGLGGIVWSEVRPLAGQGAVCQNYMIGLGGGDIRPEHIEKIVDDLVARETTGEPVMMEVAA
jgi:pyruvate/2-oxoacid:ferredoxin oxidoreductase alpha subunit